MNDLFDWFSKQHHGLRTFRIFRHKLDNMSRDEPEQRGLCRLLSQIIDRYIETFDEEPLPVEVAAHAHDRMSALLAGIDLLGSPERRLADINRVAASDLMP